MATFNLLSNILPDPVNLITDAGDNNMSGAPGPGFSALNFQSVTDTQVSRTNSGRGVARDGGSHRWEFTISYNPMFRDQFEPIEAFLLARNPRKQAFYVQLPQYSKPKNPAFASFASSNLISVAASYDPGSSTIMLSSGADFTSFPKPGDALTFSDTSDYNHQKFYKVAGVETVLYYQAGTTQPTTKQVRVRVAPPLQRSLAQGATVNFIAPKIRVVSKSDIQEYSLNTDNLYSFSLAVEELQP